MSPNSRNAYMAGLMDGEGSFSISVTHETGKPHYAVNIRLYNTNPRIIQWVIAHFGGKPSWGDKNGSNIENLKSQKKICQWFLTGRKAMESFILSVLPYLVAKREQANLLLQYIRMDGKHDPAKRQAIADRISELNKETQDTPTTNTQDNSSELVIESELTGNRESDPIVI
jgi:hypothetical protein